MSSVEDLPSSKLGTKEHWDEVYEREVENFEEIGEEGEVWFGEDSVEKMIDWALDNVPSEESGPTVLDMGTGNGHLLFELVSNGYQGKYLKGVDYSPASVKLSNQIAKSKGDNFEEVAFDVVDVLDKQQISNLGQWDVVMDKGTFDAICLSVGSNRLLYAQQAAELVKKGGKLLITSCNFTEEEVKSTFEADMKFKYDSRVNHPTFSFGGSKGSTICTVAFERI
ncbi:S-adenosyl-L-methionine-dependent methyltransferase [Wallemia mellicola CBS 633.66]|uniref:Protein-lysine N-methyltransferase EFM4 n=1 Tax=Wallemia mellicola (strain ATCC MYA-4683 / CBS 633.66) TaxID=671144 RepID=I4Y9C7_WALMC|nr:S-adenosyl-L-methionine-dependent methyltransferase [Wallemia mellicola CBS 633.66]EIM20569.1 S-adenosyl-L-methionine-dependent methyltransferase [Wallemia mellicola CBS 633.66]|eukprot:XP_006959361.1 S-adenosyl-L-methionine-dependent methyltransferase [Wallemia mellicola CBS 633.66]